VLLVFAPADGLPLREQVVSIGPAIALLLAENSELLLEPRGQVDLIAFAHKIVRVEMQSIGMLARTYFLATVSTADQLIEILKQSRILRFAADGELDAIDEILHIGHLMPQHIGLHKQLIDCLVYASFQLVHSHKMTHILSTQLRSLGNEIFLEPSYPLLVIVHVSNISMHQPQQIP
jgi:hypothetical protein